MALEGLFPVKDQGQTMSESVDLKYPRMGDILDYILMQQPKLLDSAEIREEKLLFPSKMYLSMIRFLLKCFEADVEQSSSMERTSEYWSSIEKLCLLLEHAMALEGSVELHASASKALITVGSRTREMVASRYSMKISWVKQLLSHLDWETRESAARLLGIVSSALPISGSSALISELVSSISGTHRLRFEAQHGALCAIGYVTADCTSRTPAGVRRCTDHPIGNYVTYEGLSPSYRAFATSLDDTQVPNTIQETFKISEWKKAVQDEIDALEKNGTWTITDLPVGKRPVGCKWIFTIKYKADGSVERFKARLQLDIKNAFLNGDLEKEVYMEIPLGFEGSMAKNQVCKLQKSLYDLKQSPRAWFDRFTKAVLKLGYKQGQADHTLFVKKSHAGKMAILIVYVDDIILSGNDTEELQNLKKYLLEEFEVKDLGNLKYFLGMEVARSRKGIIVSQRKYILDLLKETGMLGCKPIDTPMDSQKKLGIEKESTPVDRGRCQRLVGRLIYLSHTRPNIGFAVSAVSQFMHSPTEEHMKAVYRILRYLKMTPGKGLFFRKTENRDTERSKKQSVVARSSAEAEYRALAQGICSYKHSKEPVHHDRTKHVEIDRHFITEKVTSETVKLNYVPTKHQTADILTKALPRPNFEDLTCKLGLYDIYSPA
ncbi:Retrovirus-related Pol polyprotein from transposon RE1 [Vitis vinifera]|uniref:Retrovirus-related Pol polyprotein from transposon RE1 n=1 Tax=Vitis vinifera TaxID=29760 RepID=A0A438I872_VITVI|nr:Retrovirus-related Pol polyprotein from transposon RE1 [Vitis vinifera]